MSATRLICIILVLILAVSASTIQIGEDNQIGKNLISLLYGDQWALNQYCNDTRPLKTKLEDDIDTLSLYNGTYLDAENLINEPERLERANVIGSLSRRYVALICSVNNWGYASEQLENQSNEPHENELQCARDLEEFNAFVNSYTRNSKVTQTDGVLHFDLNLWKQFSSFGRIPSGPVYKNDLLLGDYDTCTQLPATRYCLGAYGRRLAADHSNSTAPFKIGLCLPRSCSSRILVKSDPLMQVINRVIKRNLLPTAIENSANYQLNDVHCAPLPDSPWSQGQVATSDLLGQVLSNYLPKLWLFLLASGTLCGYLGIQQGRNLVRKFLIEPFDLRANWKSFCNSAHTDPKLAGLNGAKALCMVWLMLTHVSMTMDTYLADPAKLRISQLPWFGAVILQGQHGVPVFFTISGILSGYKYLNRDRISVKNMLLARYLRLLPLYLVVYAYIKRFGHLTNDGPLWDHGVSVQSEARQCMAESWLVPILMLANFTSPFAHCIITGWHIANDFQIFLFLPLLFWLYRQSPRLGRLAVGSTFLVTHGSHVWLWANNPSFDYFTLASEPAIYGPRLILDRVALDYVNPLGRVGTYCLGILVADLLLLLSNNSANSSSDTNGNKNKNNNSLRTAPTMVDSQQGVSSTLDKFEQALDERQGTVNDGQSSRAGGWLRGGVISSFKDTLILLFGMQAAYNSLFTVILPLELKMLLGPNSKALSYPWVRFNVEIGWAICLYYLLRDNTIGGHREDSSADKQHSVARKTTTNTRDDDMTKPGNGHDDDHNRHVDDDDDDDDQLQRQQQAGNPKVRKNSRSPTRPAETSNQADRGGMLVEIGQTSWFVPKTNHLSRGGGCGGGGGDGHYFNLNFGGSLLKFPFWNVLVKLNFTIMLVHYVVIRHVIQSQRQLILFSWMNYFQLTSFIIVLTYMLSLVVHLAIEMPLMALTKLLIVKITGR